MINKPLEDINEDDLQQLVKNATPEKRGLEYKRELPSNVAKSKLKLLAQLSSLANTDGGDLLIGVTEDREKGVPKEISGIESTNPDQEILRMQQMVLYGISPRMSAYFRSVNLANGRVVIIVRVPPSWRSPHRLILEGEGNFYARDSAGKHPMDVDELRNAFLFSDGIRKSLSAFRDDRIFAIQSDETPEPLDSSARTVMHLIPLVSISRPINLDIKKIESLPKYFYALSPMGHSADSRCYNFEGYLTYVASGSGTALTYLQLFRNGIIESVEACSFAGRGDDGREFIYIATLEESIIKSLKNHLMLYQDFEIPPPIYVCVSLLGFKNHTIPYLRRMAYPFQKNHKIGRDVLRLPERTIEDFGERTDLIMKPIFDALWNAAGYSEDPYYNDEGTWVGPNKSC